MGMSGLNPLMGPNLDEIGPRFPDMSQAYDKELGATARKVASEKGITITGRCLLWVEWSFL